MTHSPPAGVFAALATPLTPAHELDETALRALVERILTAGADGLSPTGSTGEGARLTPDQRARVTACVRELAGPDVPIISGVPVGNPGAAVREIAAQERAGADAVLVSIQAIYDVSETDVRRLYQTLADSAALPIVLYNIPRYTGLWLSPTLVSDLATHPNVAGIKDSSQDMQYLQQILFSTARAQFRVYTGTDALLLASLAIGVHGTIAASVNLVPDLVVGIYRAYQRGDLSESTRLQERLANVVAACRCGTAPAGWKAALQMIGVCGDTLAEPASPLPVTLRDELAKKLTDLGVVNR